jgi:hypothetical protein
MTRYADHHQKRITRKPGSGRKPVDTTLSRWEYRARVGKTTRAFYEAFLPEDHPEREGLRA